MAMKCTQCGTEHPATANSNGLCFDCFKEAQPITQEPCSACDEYTSQGAEACLICGETIHYDTDPMIAE